MSALKIVFCTILSGLIVAKSSLRMGTDVLSKSDSDKTVKEYIESNGYKFEEHFAETEDGYILTLWRIPCKSKGECKPGQPVLMQHGIVDNGFSWLFQKIDRNLAMHLLDQGYDIWIGNVRGTRQSLRHKTLDPYDSRGAYWDFTWHEMGLFDLPGMVEYIKGVTHTKQVKYVCHSQGCTMSLVLGSLRPDYLSANFERIAMFAPAIYLYLQESFVMDIARLIHFSDIFLASGFKNVFAQQIFQRLSAWIGKNFRLVWIIVLDIITGFKSWIHIDYDRIPLIAAAEPGGTSIMTYHHFEQGCYNKTFRYYDLGKENNLKKYGQEYPPLYPIDNFQKIDSRIKVYYGARDSLVSPKAMKELFTHLRPGFFESFEISDANHIDVVWADFLRYRVYPNVLKFFGASP